MTVAESERPNAKAIFVAMAVIAVLMGVMVLCLVSAVQKLEPVNMPFGVVGTSQVITGVEDKVSLDTTTYSSESDARAAVERGDIYGAYVSGPATDTLILAPAKSFFAGVELTAVFESAAQKGKQPLKVDNAVPLPKSDRLGGVSGLLLLPTLIGGYLMAMMLAKSTGTIGRRTRIAVLAAFSVVSALVIDLIAGPLIGAYANEHFWPLFACFALVSFAVSASATAIMGLGGRFGSLIVALLFIVIGGSSSGGAGVSLLPSFWQSVGTVLPPQNAVEMYRNVIYFDGHSITTPIVVLALYALVGIAVVLYVHQRQEEQSPETKESKPPGAEAGASSGRLVTVGVPIAIAGLLTCLFAINYMSAAHSPEANDMPFGVVGQSKLVSAVGEDYSLSVNQYSDEAAIKEAIDKTDIWGGLIPGENSNTLIVVPSISDIAPLDLASQFEVASKDLGMPVKVQTYTPTPLAQNDPAALVIGVLLLPMLIGGYLGASVLANVGRASGPYHGLILLGYAAATALLIDLIATVVLKGLPGDAFWLAWPIMTLVIVVVGVVTGVLRRLLGPLGIIATIIVFIQFGNPSSGGSNGFVYLPNFWADIGPYLPPRNAYILLRNSVYFGGNGTLQALGVLLAYLIVFAVIFSLLNWFRSPTREVINPETEEAAGAAAAGAVSTGVA